MPFLAISASLMAIMMGISVNFAVKYAADQSVPQHMILFFRLVGGMVFVLPVMFYYGRRSYVSKAPAIQGLRALMMTLSIALFFWTISVIPVGVAGAIQNLSPLFIPIGGLLFLREKFSAGLFLPVFVGLFGAMLATEVSAPSGELFILSVGVLSAALGGLTAPLGKHLQKYDDLLVMVTWPAFVGISVVSFWCFYAGFSMPPLLVVLYLSGAGAMGYLGWFLTQWAYQHFSSGVIAPIRYMAIPMNLLGAMLFFGERFSATALAGIGLILLGCLLPWLEPTAIRRQLKRFQRWIGPVK